MIEPSFGAPLVAAVGATPLTGAGLPRGRYAAVALSAIAVRADQEHRVAFDCRTNPLPENHFAMSRHVRPAGGAGQRQRFMAG